MWTSDRISIVTLAATLSHLILVDGALAADNAIDTRGDVNRHFEEASKHFGNGIVQLHSRQEGPDGTQHSVHQFDCANNSYDAIFAGGMAPDAFPAGTPGLMGSAPGAIADDPTIASLAQHTCTKYGHPLAEW